MKPFSFGNKEVAKVVKVFAWSVGSAVIALLLGLIEVINIPAQYAFVVPAVNTILYSLKEWIADNQE